MSLLRNLQLLGQHYRAGFGVPSQNHPVVKAVLQELNTNNMDAFTRHLSGEQINLLTKVEKEVKAEGKSIKALAELLGQADDLHQAFHGLVLVGCLLGSPDVNSYEQLRRQFDKIVELLGQAGLTFNSAAEAFCLSGRLLSNPMACYKGLPGASQEDKSDEPTTTISVVIIEHSPPQSTSGTKPSLDIAPSTPTKVV